MLNNVRSILLPWQIYLHRGQVGMKIYGLLGCHAVMWWLRKWGSLRPAACPPSLSSLVAPVCTSKLHVCKQPPHGHFLGLGMWLLEVLPWENWPGEGSRRGLGTLRQRVVPGTQGVVWKRRCRLGVGRSPWRGVWPGEDPDCQVQVLGVGRWGGGWALFSGSMNSSAPSSSFSSKTHFHVLFFFFLKIWPLEDFVLKCRIQILYFLREFKYSTPHPRGWGGERGGPLRWTEGRYSRRRKGNCQRRTAPWALRDSTLSCSSL